MSISFVRYLSVLCLGAWFFAGGVLKSAAVEPEVLFEDNFSELDGSFASTDTIKIAVENQNLVMTNQMRWKRAGLYQSALFQDSDISLRVQLAAPDAEKGAFIGIGFWGLNYSEYFMFAISDSGTFAIVAVGARNYFPISWRPSSALKTGVGDWNELRIVTVGNRAVAFLNGSKVATIKGKPPQGGSLMGPIFSAGSETTSGRCSNLKVVAPAVQNFLWPPEEVDPNLIYSDDFSQLDPGWGIESGIFSVKNKTLVIKPNVGRVHRFYYGGTLVDEMDASIKVKISDKDPESLSSAGIVFWGTAADDYYMLYVTNQGKVGVNHVIKDRWLNPLASRPIPTEAHDSPDGVHQLRVVTSGKKATVSISGVVIGSVTAVSPIKGEWQFGVCASAGKSEAVAELQSLVVHKPQAAEKQALLLK